jgi:hypothetical protein
MLTRFSETFHGYSLAKSCCINSEMTLGTNCPECDSWSWADPSLTGKSMRLPALSWSTPLPLSLPPRAKMNLSLGIWNCTSVLHSYSVHLFLSEFYQQLTHSGPCKPLQVCMLLQIVCKLHKCQQITVTQLSEEVQPRKLLWATQCLIHKSNWKESRQD